MTVDRTARDDLLAALVAFMRRELNNIEFDKRIAKALSSKDKSAHSVYEILYCQYDDFSTHFLRANEDSWNGLRRVAAFLQTNLTLTTKTFCSRRPRQWHAALSLAILLAFSMLSSKIGTWVPLIGAWAVIGLVWFFLLQDYPIPQQVLYAWRFMPFHNEEEWRRYEPLANQLALPPFDPEVYDKPGRAPWEAWLMLLPGRLLGAVLVPLALLWGLQSDKYEVHLVEPTPATQPTSALPVEHGRDVHA